MSKQPVELRDPDGARLQWAKSLYFDRHSGLDPESRIFELDSRRTYPVLNTGRN